MNVIFAGFSVENSPSALTANVTGVGESRIESLLSKNRLLVPVLLMAILAAKNVVIDHKQIVQFQSLSKEQFLGAAAGFLTHRVSLLVTEVLSEIKVEDWLSILPGSIAETFRRLQGLKTASDTKVRGLNLIEAATGL